MDVEAEPPRGPSEAPKRNLSQGLRSLAVLAILGSASAIAGFVVTDKSAETFNIVANAAAPPPLALTLINALDVVEVAPAERRFGKLERNETLTGLVTRLGAEAKDANAALHTLYSADMLDARRLRPGSTTAEAYLENGRLEALSIRAEADRSLLITRSLAGDWQATALNAKLTPGYMRVNDTISTSIYEAALANGASDQQVADFASAFAYDIDFQREIHPGDTFEIFFETFYDERGRPVRNGAVLYAALEGKALTRGFYHFTPSDDAVPDYYDQNGDSATKFLMKTPINGARLSSSFGTRRHPISGYTRLHKGTDFAAPTGTPIYAAGHGTIERANRNGGYGNYVRIRHSKGYETAYAHLSRFAKGIKSGTRVRQGDVIGYVGSTGASTGPHLHYEVWVNDKPVNAMSLKLPTGRKLAEAPEILAEFEALKAEIDAMRTTSAEGATPTFASLPSSP